MHWHLTPRLTAARLAAMAVGLGVLAVAIPALDAGPAAAEGAGAAFTATRCLSGDGWGATLSITAAHPERNPVALVSTAAGPYSVAVPPAGYSTLITGVSDQIVVGVTLSWSDTTTQDLGAVTADRPGHCVDPSVVATTPPTTTCAEAIPPRGDCGVAPAATTPATATPAISGAATAAETRLDVEATLLALQVAPTPQQRPAAHPPAAALPATGSFPAAVVVAGAAALVAGLALVTAGRATRRAP